MKSSIQRDNSIDFFKGILTSLMILAHVIQFFSEKSTVGFIISQYVNLTTFSGFFFIFGYTHQIAYFNKKDTNTSKTKILRNSINVLFIYYLSALSFRFFISNNLIENGLSGLFKILFFFDIPGYSEFLLSFFILLFFSFLFIKKLKVITTTNKLIISLFCLAFTFIPLEWLKINQLGLIIGSHEFASFPIIQYLPYFILGTIFAKEKIEFKKTHFYISILFTLSLLFFIFFTHKIPNRFPPSITWILGAAAFIYCYYIFSKKINNNKLFKFTVITEIGTSTFFYLIISNIFIFAIKSNLEMKINLFYCFVLSLFLIFFIYRLRKIVK
tara:strand:+ start:2527 stop:3510 length:984 start_codon:yes stop_codon:yes gene_type:complete